LENFIASFYDFFAEAFSSGDVLNYRQKNRESTVKPKYQFEFFNKCPYKVAVKIEIESVIDD
jgi:hypothetical protein